MGTFHGSVGIRIGAGVASSAFGTSAIMQSYDVESKGDEVEVKDKTGNVVSWWGTNPTSEATFTYYVGSATLSESASVVKPAFGAMISVTEDLTGSGVSGSYWITKSSTANATNTDAVKVTVKATTYPSITS